VKTKGLEIVKTGVNNKDFALFLGVLASAVGVVCEERMEGAIRGIICCWTVKKPDLIGMKGKLE